MIEQTQIELQLFADYFQFYIQDEKVSGDLSNSWNNEAVKILLALAPGTIGIGTVRNMNVPVKIKIFEDEPNFLTDFQKSINQINECDLDISSGKIVVAGCTDNFFDAKRIVLENGIYRSRIYYGNLDKLSENQLEGEDFYEIHLWKKIKHESATVIKQREYHEQHAAHFNPELF